MPAGGFQACCRPIELFAIIRLVPNETEAILSLQGLSKVYPGTVALQGVDLQIRRGETHGIIGKNGAGKTTLVGIVAGLIRPTAGVVRVNGHDYARLTRIAARKLGVAIVPQEPQMVQEATIAENLFMPDYVRRANGTLVDWFAMQRAAADILRKGNLNLDVRTKAADVGPGVQQILLMLRASYVEQTEIIILDEAFASLSEREERLFYELIRERKQAGCTILHISHRIDELLQVCDRMTVLRDGRSIRTVRREEVDKDSLAALIVGEDQEHRGAVPTRALPTRAVPTRAEVRRGDGEHAARKVFPEQPPVLVVERLTLAERFHNISFAVHRNEILGIAGLIGSGRTSILKSIFGLEPHDSGVVRLNGKEVAIDGPITALRHGVVYLPEERDEEGLVTSLSVRSNLVLSALRRVANRFMIDKIREQELARSLAGQLALTFASFDQEVSELSGGNRQKVVVGKVLSTEPQVFLLDEPTKGIDIAAKTGLLHIIRDELRANAAIIVTSPGLDDLMEICDRIIVVYDGTLLGSFRAREFQEERLYKAIQGNVVQGDETP